jgi:hypothetical protein
VNGTIGKISKIIREDGEDVVLVELENGKTVPV